MKNEFLEYVKERESKYLGSNIDKDDLITIEDANKYFNEFEQLRIGGVSQQRELLFALLRYTMPDQFTDVALKNIVKGFEEHSK